MLVVGGDDWEVGAKKDHCWVGVSKNPRVPKNADFDDSRSSGQLEATMRQTSWGFPRVFSTSFLFKDEGFPDFPFFQMCCLDAKTSMFLY